MILQALTEYYRVLADRGVLEAPGWSSAKISLCPVPLSRRHAGTGHLPTNRAPRGKKLVVAPQLVPSLPAPVKRSSGVSANFLWDNASYLLGMDNKGKPQRSLACFSASKRAPRNPAEGVDSPGRPGTFGLFPHLGSHARPVPPPPYRTNWKASSPAATCCFGMMAGLSTRTLPFAKPGKPTTTPRARGPRESVWSPENGGAHRKHSPIYQKM